MGFYGNITNTSNTTFSFDRIYPNRLAMDANANNDGIFIGRYVLVEYQEEAAYPVAYHATETSEDSGQYYFYSSTNQEEISKIKYLGLPPGEPDRLPSVDDVNAIYQDGFYNGEILQRYIYSSDKKDWIFSEEFYACVGEDDKHFAIFELITNPSMKSYYIQNFEIDEKHYGQESKGFKGYDSTVWMKSSVTASDGKLITKYVNIADLNSVVPTFDIAADAPTEQPLTPHFDADSTNVYYKLHMQTPFGFRVKETSVDRSDEQAVHYTTKYDKETNTTTTTTKMVDADIFYNKDALTFRKNDISNRVTESGIDEIKIVPTGKSENFSTKYSHYSKGENIGDIQELSVHLPSVGYMVSQGWDIIHGPNRDDAQTDDNSSLQGRLDSFKAMEKDAIPMKRNSDGTFVGSRINGNSNRAVGTNKILEENLSTSFDQDDAWIRTEIDTMGLDNTNKLSGISIHHTWHKQADTTSTTNKNNDNVSSSKVSDKIDLYTPIVDKAGHVVGKNTETVTLPYGYKTITTNGRGEDTEINTFDKVAAKTQNIVAENTQDELAINSGNEWIRIDTDAINDILTISHDIHKTSSDSHDTDWTQTETNTTIPTITYEFDNAGHYVSHHTENYKLPFGYGKIVGDVGNSAATATYDQIKLTSDEWLTATITEEGEDNTTVVTYSHDYPNVQEDTSTDFDMNTATTQDNKDKIVLETLRHDDTGHIINVNQHTVTLPYGYKTIKVANSSNEDSVPATIVEDGQSADQTQDTLNLNASNKWIVLDNAADNTIKFGHKLSDLSKGWHSSSDTTIGEFGESFKILKYETDEAGHVIDSGEDVITIPQGSYTAAIEASGSKEIITSIGFTPSSGAITSTKANTDTLSLSNYSANTNEHSKLIDIVDTDTINNAFKKIQNHINGLNLNVNEVTDDTKIITGIVQKNGQVSLSRSTAGNLQIGTPSADGTIPANSSLNNAFNITNNRIKEEEDALAQEVQDRKDAIAKEVSDRNTAITNAIAGIFDKNDDNEINKLAEIIEWINNNPSTATEMQAAIQSNTDAISNEVDLARENEGKIADALTTETGRATTAEQGLQGQIEVLQAWKETATDTISQLQTTIENLQKQIDDLKNPPQESDEGGETV